MSTFTFFPSVVDQVEGRMVRFRVARCKNGHEQRIKDSSAGGLPPQALSKMFRQKGWEIAANYGNKICPKCKEGRPQKHAWPAIHAKAAEKREKDLVASKPAEPTREDKRLIRDALDEHYDEKAERYTKAWSDKALASKLNKPVKWVADIREEFYGPDINEASAVRASEVAALRKRVDEVESAMMDRLVKEMEALKADLKKIELDASYAA